MNVRTTADDCSQRFLQSRDANFDAARAFLVVTMILAHVHETFYEPDFNRNLTAFVTIGFVFLSGFTAGTIYAQKVAREPLKYFKKFSKQSLKLLGLFVASNIAIFASFSDRWIAIEQYSRVQTIEFALLGLSNDLFGFEILVPIALTMFLSCFILLENRVWPLFQMATVFVLLSLTEILHVFNYFNVKFTLIGLFGCLLGKYVSSLQWKDVAKRFIVPRGAVGACLLVLSYYACIVFFTNKRGELLFWYHILPTLLLLFFVYTISGVCHLSHKKYIKTITQVLSENMLFAYLLHILLINALFRFFIQKKGFALLETEVLSFGVLGVTLLCCQGITFTKKRSQVFSSFYSLIFR